MNTAPPFSVVLLLAALLHAPCQSLLGAPASPANQAAIDTFVTQLGDKDFTVRERASAALKEIGDPALPALRAALRSSDLDMRRRASTLVDAIELLQTRTLVKGLEFQLATQGTWTIPARGKQTPIRLALMVTNRSDKVQAVNLLDTLRVVVQDRSGQPLPFRRYKNSLVTAFHTPPLAKNASFRVGYLNAKLVWAFDQLTLQGADGSGGTWYLPGLHAGSYSLSIHYQNRQLMPPQGPVSFWVGEAQTRPRPVTLMP